MSDDNAEREESRGRVRIGRWSLPWHRAWWFTAAFLTMAMAGVYLRIVLEEDEYDLAPRKYTILVLLALAAYFWAYGQWRRRRDFELVSSEAQHWLVLLFAVILARTLWPLGWSDIDSWTCTPISTVLPFVDDMPRACQDDLGVRTTEIVVLGLLAIPLAIATAVNRTRERLSLDDS
ncbi:hypothetical protein [Rhizohabitans arisaemae]|uniref:hypothetical protein n=1 Tax=Rhizohabitans arisaemae TaxID=2720610 RepID=UPI0024B1766F|nr:hypothetical protein [Rhizohabitans arisaemae]